MVILPTQPESKIRKVLFNEVTALVAVIGVVVGVMNWVNSPVVIMDKNIALIQKDIQTINTNHLTHLQNYAEKIKDLQEADNKLDEKIAAQEKQLNEINQQTLKALTILEALEKYNSSKK